MGTALVAVGVIVADEEEEEEEPKPLNPANGALALEDEAVGVVLEEDAVGLAVPAVRLIGALEDEETEEATPALALGAGAVDTAGRPVLAANAPVLEAAGEVGMEEDDTELDESPVLDANAAVAEVLVESAAAATAEEEGSH